MRKSRNIFILLALSLLSPYIIFILQFQASNFFNFFLFYFNTIKTFFLF